MFSEQGASASLIAAAKFLYAIARMTDCKGEDSDAVGAYTQVVLKDMLLQEATSSYVETWVSLPYHKRPASWSKYDDPGCILRFNLYGHPLAGLCWGIHCSSVIITWAGFEKTNGWECLYARRKEQFFLSVYVDDFKIAGEKKKTTEMWKR